MAQDQRAFSRRIFCCTLAGVLAAPGIAIAQASKAVRRIGWLDIGPLNTPEEIRKQAAPLRELGWVEGQNLHIERRYANSLEELKPLAEELVRAKVEVIVADGPNPTRAAMRATATIPIVFRVASDAVLSGLVVSLARPGGNVTGFSGATPEVVAKLLSLTKELLPTLQRIGMLETSGNPQYRLMRERLEHACQSLGIEPVFVEIAAAEEIDGAVTRFAQQRVQALLLRPDGFAVAHGSEIVNAALKRGLATITVRLRAEDRLPSGLLRNRR